jgi:CheY-like chemotaxis protein
VLELLADGSHEYWAHLTSPGATVGEKKGIRYESLIGTANYTQVPRALYTLQTRMRGVSLDLYVSCAQNDAVIASAESHHTESATRTILIVDDDRSVTDTFARILKLEGFSVATALSAEAGLELADNIRPDGILLDLRMPITSGLQFLRLIRSRPHLVDVPVAIVTGDYFLPDPIQNELKTLGASVRFKPMWLEDLVALARTLVSS